MSKLHHHLALAAVLWAGLCGRAHAVDCVEYGDDIRWLAMLGGLGHTYAAAADGNLVFTAGERQFSVIDVSDPAAPTILGVLELDDVGLDVYLDGDIAYVSDCGSGLRAIDVSSPASPQYVDTWQLAGCSRGMVISSPFAYVADSWGGVHLVVIEPDSPYPQGYFATLATASHARAVKLMNGLLYVAEADGLEIFDVTDPENILQICNYPVAGGMLDLDLTLAGHVIATANGVLVLNVLDPAMPWVAGVLELPSVCHRLTVVGDVAFVAGEDSGLFTVDISSLEDPRLIGHFDTPGEAFDVAVLGMRAYLADKNKGLQIMDVASVTTESMVESFATTAAAISLSVVDDLAYVIENQRFEIIDLSGESPTILGGMSLPPYGQSKPTVERGIAYFPGHSTMVSIVDVSDPTTPALLGSIPTNAWGVDVEGPLAFVAAGYAGLKIYDVSNPGSPLLLGQEPAPDLSVAVQVVGDLAYLVTEVPGLRIIDVANPAAPHTIGAVDTPSYAKAVQVIGDLAYVADQFGGLVVIDVSTPWAPEVIASQSLPGYCVDFTIADGYAYVADYSDLAVISLEDPRQPYLLSNVDVPGDAIRTIALAGDRVVVAAGSAGLQFAYRQCGDLVAIESDVYVPGSPALQSFPNPFNPRTTVSFTLPETGHAVVAIYDARGMEVARLVNESLPAGAHTVDWDGRDAFGASMPSGMYFCRLTTPWGEETRKLQLVR